MPSKKIITNPKGTCLLCGQLIPLVNFSRGEFGPRYHGGYIARHGRPGIAPERKCRGSFEMWVERSTMKGFA